MKTEVSRHNRLGDSLCPRCKSPTVRKGDIETRARARSIPSDSRLRRCPSPAVRKGDIETRARGVTNVETYFAHGAKARP
jgi:hypothetical protein